MKAVGNFVTTVIGAGVGGSSFFYASHGQVSWWFVAGVFAWVISMAAVCSL